MGVKIKLLNKILLILIIVQTMVPKEALAYIDPGSGSYFTQVILGMLLGASFFGKSMFDRIKSLFVRKEGGSGIKNAKNGKSKTKKTS